MMVSGSKTRLSKTIARQGVRERSFPLQTRACFLPASLLGDTDDLRLVLDEYERRGYNAVVVPALVDGTLLFRTNADGGVSRRRCPGREALRLLAEYTFANYIYLDLLSAGASGTSRLGSLAHAHLEWLMKDFHGTHRIHSAPDRPGLFCWTSLHYRRFLGNLLVDLLDAFPVDGLLFDVRQYPQTSTRPETWSHFGVNCLRRIQKELDIELVHFLADPTEMEFDRIVEWRQEEFEHFLENIKARVQKSRHHVLTQVLATVTPEIPAGTPWIRCFAKGTVEQVALLSPPAELGDALALLDTLAQDRRPVIAAVEREANLPELSSPISALPMHGFVTLEPDFENPAILPVSSFSWERYAPPELYPIDAAERILKRLVEQVEKTDPISLFFMELDEYFSTGAEEIAFRHVARLRNSVQMIRRMIAEESGENTARRGEIIRELDLVARILLLAPAPPIEY